MIFRFLRADKGRRWPRLHQLLHEIADLTLVLGDVLFIIDLVDVLVLKVGLLRILFVDLVTA